MDTGRWSSSGRRTGCKGRAGLSEIVRSSCRCLSSCLLLQHNTHHAASPHVSIILTEEYSCRIEACNSFKGPQHVPDTMILTASFLDDMQASVHCQHCTQIRMAMLYLVSVGLSRSWDRLGCNEARASPTCTIALLKHGGPAIMFIVIAQVCSQPYT